MKRYKYIVLTLLFLISFCTDSKEVGLDFNRASVMNPDAIATVAKNDFQNYSARIVYDAVAELSLIKKDAVLNRIESYLEIDSSALHSIGLFALLCTLFDLPKGIDYPEVGLGNPTFPEPDNRSTLPRFPFIVVNEVPSLIVNGYFLGGFPDNISNHLEFYRVHGSIRKPQHDYPDSWEAVEPSIRNVWQVAYGSELPPKMLQRMQKQI